MKKFLKFIILLVLAIGLGFILINGFGSFSKELTLLIDDVEVSHGLKIMDENIYLSYKTVKEFIDKDIFYDIDENKIIITGENVNRYVINENYYTENSQAKDLPLALLKIDDDIWISYDILLNNYNIDMNFWDKTNIVTVNTRLKDYKEYNVTKNRILIKNKPNLISKFMVKRKGSGNLKIRVYDETDKYVHMRTEDGNLGYLDKKYLGDLVDEYVVNKIIDINMDKKINLTWDYTYRKFSRIEDIKKIPGLNVIAPTFYSLKADGIEDKSHPEYRRRYNNLGIDVWALVDNSFDPDLTRDILSSSKKREDLINDLLKIYKINGYQGINIDFENVHLESKDDFTQFVRELYPLFKKEGMLVSVDITGESTSENWSKFYDRERLADTSDYLVYMGYDQHWASSPVGGSVAEYTWVENNINQLLDLIPKEKFILAVPFYTRLWTTEDGVMKSRALGMETANKFIEDNKIPLEWDENARQFHGQVTNGTINYQIWSEDAKSIGERIKLIHQYDLAGVASWRKGFETENIWQVINGALEE